MTYRQYDDYTFEGQRALGEAVAYFRESDKPYWTPVATQGMKQSEIESEKGYWSQSRMAQIINREFGLSGELKVTQSAIFRLESPPLNRTEPPLRLIELIASLKIMIDPKSQKPFTDIDLRNIAKGLLDWRTGEQLNPCFQDSQA